jgi:hypothetical protein
MMGPNFLAMFASVTCGMVPKCGRTPRIGHPLGPGGRFLEVFLRIKLMEKCEIKKMKSEIPISLRRNKSKVMLCCEIEDS